VCAIAATPERAYFSHDYGEKEVRVPAVVFIPQSAEQVLHAFEYCGERGLPLAARGGGCSSNGLSLSAGAVADMRMLRALSIDESARTVRAAAGVRIGELTQELRKKGLRIPVLPSNPSATLGGVLAAGGFGQTSVKHGPLAAHVESLTLATPAGGIQSFQLSSAPERRSFFGAFGALGLMIEATLRAVPITPLYIERLRLEGLRPSAACSRLIAGEPNYLLVVHDLAARTWNAERAFATAPVQGDFSVMEDVHDHVQRRELQFLARRSKLLEDLSAASGCFQCWGDFFLPPQALDEFMERVYGINSSRLILPYAHVSFFPRTAAAMASGFDLLPLQAGFEQVSVGLYGVARLPDQQYVEEIFDVLREQCLRASGRQYLYGAFPQTVNFVRRQFGSAVIDGVRTLKRRVDPDALLGGLPL
jgi:FAD/FMN-containing dehydrogenase